MTPNPFPHDDDWPPAKPLVFPLPDNKPTRHGRIFAAAAVAAAILLAVAITAAVAAIREATQ